MAASHTIDHQSSTDLFNPDIEESLNLLRRCLSDFSDSCHVSLKPDVEDKLNEIHDWVTEHKKSSKITPTEFSIENVGKVLQVLQVTVNSIEKFKSEDPLDVASGVLDIISTIGFQFGGSYGPIIKAICGIIGAILSYNKPKLKQPIASVVDQLAKVVHKELVNFNHKLQNQKYEGLKGRVSDQISQLRMMKPGERLDDPNLWNDYVQFMGELSNRFESSLPFKYDKESLTKDPDVADFVTAVVSYCYAYSCFMALLMAAKGKFADLGSEYKDDEDAVDRKIRGQNEKAKEKLAFLSDEKYLTFLGRLPYEGGKLTKIVVLSRNTSGKRMVEAVRGSLCLARMPDLKTVESAASNVSRQSVKLKLEGQLIHSVHNRLFPRLQNRLFEALNAVENAMFGVIFVEFINETNLPMKIVSGTVGRRKLRALVFVNDVQPRSSCWLEIQDLSSLLFSTGGYIILYQNGILSSDVEPPARNVRVIEFALSSELKINIEDKTSSEFTRGLDTYNAMNSGEAKTLYWFDHGEHFMLRGEIARRSSHTGRTFRFLVQDFDPFAVRD